MVGTIRKYFWYSSYYDYVHSATHRVVGKLNVSCESTFTLEQTLSFWVDVKKYLYIFFNLDAKRGWVVSVRSRPLYSRERDLCAFYRTKRGPKCRSGRVRKIWPPLHCDPRKVQPEARLYTTAERVLQIQKETQETAQQSDQVGGVQSGDK